MCSKRNFLGAGGTKRSSLLSLQRKKLLKRCHSEIEKYNLIVSNPNSTFEQLKESFEASKLAGEGEEVGIDEDEDEADNDLLEDNGRNALETPLSTNKQTNTITYKPMKESPDFKLMSTYDTTFNLKNVAG